MAVNKMKMTAVIRNEKKVPFYKKIDLLALCVATLAILSFLSVWHLSVVFTDLGRLIPGPGEVIQGFFLTFVNPIGRHNILGHIFFSLSRVLVGYIAAALAGITLGVLMGWNKTIEAIFRPLYEMIRPIPPIAWIPLAILWFGLGDMTRWFLIFLGAFNNITLNAYQGAKTVDPVLVGASKMLGANKFQTLLTVVVPGSIPQIFAGLHVAVSVSWATVVAAEMVRSSEGVGWVIITGQETNNMTQVLIGIIAIGIIGYLLAILMRKVEEKLCSWNKIGR